MTALAFEPFPKIPRLRRNVVITEKLDGTNAQVMISDDGTVSAGSRKRAITSKDDNYGFARWTEDNASVLSLLGPGRHFGEWWGQGIQRGYGLTVKRFSLFNAGRWAWIEQPTQENIGAADELRSVGVSVVPVLAEGHLTDSLIDGALAGLRAGGSVAAPGFMQPEGIIVYHTQRGDLYKVLIDNDDTPKGNA